MLNAECRVNAADAKRLAGNGEGVSRVQGAALAVLLALAALRGIIAETPTHEQPGWTRHINAPVGSTPATTLWIDGVILATAVAVVADRAARGGPRFAWTGVEIGAALMVAAGIISTRAADQKRLAITGVVDFLALLVFFITLRQLLRRNWQVRLALCVMLSTGAAAAYKCGLQVWFEFPDTLKHYQEHFKAAGGETATRYDFEQRLRSSSASGFSAHPNVAATYLATIALAALAVAAARRPRWSACVVPAMVALAATGAMVLTKSKGAAVASVAGLLLWLVWRLARRWLRAHARLGLLLAWLLVIVAVGGVLAYGVAKNGLPSRSLLYRWQYWRGAAAMIRDLGWRGVGANNFGEHFTRFKPVECPEEVQDPHSWIVRAASEWGVLGIVGLCAIWVGVSMRLARGTGGSAHDHDRPAAAENGPSMLRWLLGLVALLAAGYLLTFADVWRSSGQTAYVLTNLVEIVAVWAAAFALLSAEVREVGRLRDEPLGDLRPGLVIAAIAFVLHAAADMALFASGAATLLFALLATALAAGDEEGTQARRHAGTKRGRALSVLAAGGILLAAYLYWVVMPVQRAASALADARRIDSGATWEDFERGGALTAYQRAAQADALDAAATDELLDEVLHEPSARVRTRPQADQVLGWIEELRARAPRWARADLYAARVFTIAHAMGGDVADLRRAAEALHRCVAAYPTSPERRLLYGRTLAQLAAVERSATLRREAATELRAAVRLDAQRIYISQPHRLTAEQKTEIEAEANALAP